MDDVIGRALLDYQNGNYSADIVTFSSLDEEDVIPLPYLFRKYGDMPPLEQEALKLCRGTILDIGCGAGSHSLYLQQKGHDVTALDRSKGAIETCQMRGVEKCLQTNILDLKNAKFDTLIMLMNGVGIIGMLKNLNRFLQHLKGLLRPGGQILLDSSDIIYMFDKDDDGGHWVPDSGRYYGEVEFTLEYKGSQSQAFDWLYLDFRSLKNYATECGLHCEHVRSGQHYDYLARLWLRSEPWAEQDSNRITS